MSRVQHKPLHRTQVAGQPTTVTIACTVTEQVYDDYYEQSLSRGIPVEQLMAERLTRARNQKHDCLVFTADQKTRLDHAVGHVVADAEGALQRIVNQMALKVEDVDVKLEPRLIARISTRAKAMRKDFGKCVRDEVVAGLRRFTGLDPA